jgi:hypothetical protein
MARQRVSTAAARYASTEPLAILSELSQLSIRARVLLASGFMTTHEHTVLGSCLCGGVAWEARGLLELMSHCHCSMCRKAHGAPFATFVAAAEAGFQWLRGEMLITAYRSSTESDRRFCSRCGSVVPMAPTGGKVWMPAGCLDADPGVRPQAHIFVGSKASWYEIADSLPRFEAYPPGWDAPGQERQVEPSSDPGWVRGSCLCGDVAYELCTGDWPIKQCHCSRCRKARSAAHGANLFADAAHFRWVRGKEQLRAFKVPEAERFTHVFCARCGSGMPREAGERVVVPAGSLDADPGVGSREHIFVGSKAPWFEITDELPQYPEYPPG